MTRIMICPIEAGGFGPLDGPFTLVASAPDGAARPVVETLIAFARQVSGGMSFYNNKSGFADSSLFRSLAAECFAELASDAPDRATLISNLIVDCAAVGEDMKADKSWQLYRAIFATLPGVRFCE